MLDAAERKRQNVVRQQQTNRSRIAAGRCFVCERERGATGTRTMCRVCAERMRELAQRRRAERQAHGLCIQCGQENSIGTLHCKRCCEQRRSRDRRRAGLPPFVPGEEIIVTYKLSAEQREYLRVKQHESRARRRAPIIAVASDSAPKP